MKKIHYCEEYKRASQTLCNTFVDAMQCSRLLGDSDLEALSIIEDYQSRIREQCDYLISKYTAISNTGSEIYRVRDVLCSTLNVDDLSRQECAAYLTIMDIFTDLHEMIEDLNNGLDL